MDAEQQTVVRVLVYKGPPEWIKQTLARNYVRGELKLPNGAKITELYPHPGTQTELLTKLAE